MNGEILSIETTQKIARLEKENKEYEELICKFDKEVNRQFNIIKRAVECIKNKNKTFYPELGQDVYEIDEEKLLKILDEVNNV